MEKKPRKIRRDALLKNLPESQQQLVREWLQEDGVESCAQRIASELGVKGPQGNPLSHATIYEALSFWDTQRSFLSLETQALQQIQHELGSKKLSPDEMQEAIDRRFIALAAAKNDPELYKELRYLRISDSTAKHKAKMDELKLRQKDTQLHQKDEDLRLAREKFEFDAAKAALLKVKELKAIANDRSLSEPARIEQVRLRLFGPAPEVAKK